MDESREENPAWFIVTTTDKDPFLLPGEHYDIFADEAIAEGYYVVDLPADEFRLKPLPGESGVYGWSLTQEILFPELGDKTPTPEDIALVYSDRPIMVIEAFDPRNLVHVMLLQGGPDNDDC